MAAAAGKLGDVGIDASMAGTALRKAVVSLASPTKDGAEVLDRYKIKLTDAEDKMKPLAKILTIMRDKFAGLTDTERAAATQAVFGTTAMSGMLALMKDPEGLQEFTDGLKDAGGTAETVANKQLDNLNGALTLLSSAVEGAQISIGDTFIPVLTLLAKSVNRAVTWFNGLNEGTKKMIAWFIAATAAGSLFLGGFLLFLGFLPSIINGFKSITTVTKAVGTAFSWLAANPIVLIIAAIAALIGVFIYLFKTNEAFRNKVIEVWNAILAFLQPAINAIVGFVKEQFGALVSWWGQIMPVFLEAVSNVWNGIWAVLKPIIDAIVAVMKWAFPYVLVLIQGVWENIKGVISGALGVIMDLVNIFSYLFTGQWGKLWESVKSLLGNVLKTLWNMFQIWGTGKVLKYFGGLFGRIIGAAGKFGSGLIRTAANFLGRILGRFRTSGSLITNVFKGITGSIKRLFSGMVGAVLGSLSSLTRGISSKVKKAKEMMGELNPFKRHSPSLVDNVQAGIKTIKDTYSSVSGLKVKAPQIGGLKPGRIDVAGAIGPTRAAAGAGSNTNYNAPLVNVANMHVRNDQDIRLVSSELYNLQRNTDRSRGR